MAIQGNRTLTRQYESYEFIAPSRFTGKLSGKVAVITGASSGIGRESCLAFAAAGASVACVARRQAQLDTLIAEIKDKHHVPVIAIQADVTEPTAPSRIIEQVEQELGPVDILISNAGINRLSPLPIEPDFSLWWRVVEVSLRGTAAMTHAVLPSMVKRKTGILITTSSLAGSLDVPLMSAYSCAKAALIKLQQSLVAEVEKDGILCFSVQPGTVPTEIGTTEHVFNPAAVEWPLAQQMSKDFETVKLQSPQLFANSCVAICADERFKVLNGKFIDVEQPLDEVLKEAEKPDGGRIAKEDMYHLKLDEL